MVDVAQFRSVKDELAVRKLIFADGSAMTTAPASNGGGGGAISTALEFADDFLMCPANAAFSNGWRGTASGTNSSILPITAGVIGHPGIAVLNKGSTTSGSATLHQSQTSGGNNLSLVPDADNAITVDAVLRLPSLPTALQQFTVSIGVASLTNLAGNTFVGQAFWNGSAARWRLLTQISGGALVTVVAATGPTANTFHHVQLVYTTALVTLLVDGVSVASSAADIPTLGGSPIIRNAGDGVGTAQSLLEVDLYQVGQTVPARLAA